MFLFHDLMLENIFSLTGYYSFCIRYPYVLYNITNCYLITIHTNIYWYCYYIKLQGNILERDVFVFMPFHCTENKVTIIL